MKRRLYCNTPIVVKRSEVEDFKRLCNSSTVYLEWELLMKKYGLFDSYLDMCDSFYNHLKYDFIEVESDPTLDTIDLCLVTNDIYSNHFGIELLAIIISRFHTLFFNEVFLRLLCNPEADVFGGSPQDTDDKGYLILPGQVRLVFKRWGEYDGPIQLELK